jgi:molybdopterin/thiamine biosynthesis adenylyltransferase
VSNLIFEEFHARNLQVAQLLRLLTVLIVGAGAVGSHVATQLALMGVNVTILDPDVLATPNLARTRADREYLGGQKGSVVAATIRGLVPNVQRIIGLPHDILQISQAEVWNLLQGCSAAVDATANHAASHLLNWFCLHLGIPLTVPSIWPAGQEILADLLVVPATQPDRRTGCFECLRPARPDGTPMLEAQEGLAAEVSLVASVTAMTVIGTLLPDSTEGQRLERLLRAGAGYQIMRRSPFAVVPVRNPQVPGCRACAALRERDGQPHPAAVSRARFRLPSLEDWFRRHVEEFIV